MRTTILQRDDHCVLNIQTEKLKDPDWAAELTLKVAIFALSHDFGYQKQGEGTYVFRPCTSDAVGTFFEFVKTIDPKSTIQIAIN